MKTAGLFLSLLCSLPAFAQINVLLPNVFDVRCSTALQKAPRKGLAPAYAINIRLVTAQYRMTFAFRNPAGQTSPLLIQIFFPAMRDHYLEKFIFENLHAIFASVIVEENVAFSRVAAPAIHRDDFEEKVARFETVMHGRFEPTARIFPSMNRPARDRSPEVGAAARMMLALMRRNGVGEADEEREAVLQQTHLLFVRRLGERELRFFDYSIFDEVLSYELDARMQKIAEKAVGRAPPADLDYAKVHESTRDLFLQIARETIEMRKAWIRWEANGVDLNLYHLNDLLNNIVALAAKAHDPRTFFSAKAHAALTAKRANEPVNPENAEEYLKILKGLNINNEDESIGSKEVSDLTRLRRSLPGKVQNARELLRSMIKMQEQVKSNELHEDARPNQTLSLRVSRVEPGSGGDNGVYIGADSDLPTAFLSSPRRLNSGPGNRNERFDYDAFRDRD